MIYDSVSFLGAKLCMTKELEVSTLCWAVYNNDFDMLTRLVENGADIKAVVRTILWVYKSLTKAPFPPLTLAALLPKFSQPTQISGKTYILREFHPL